MVICSRCQPRCSACWSPGSDSDSLSMNSHAFHAREICIWATVLHRIHLSHSSSLTDLPEEPSPNQHPSFVLTHSTLTLCFWFCPCSTSAYRCLGFFCIVCISSVWDRFLIILLSPCDHGPYSLTSWAIPLSLLALLSVAFNLHLPIDREAAVDWDRIGPTDFLLVAFELSGNVTWGTRILFWNIKMKPKGKKGML